MKAAINREDLHSEQLSWLSVKPMLLSVRGKDLNAKAEVYNQLSEGQRALYLFYAYHNHTHTLPEFYWFTAYYIIEIKAWNGICKSIRYFDNSELVEALALIESVIEKKLKAGGEWTMAKPQDLETDAALRKEVQEIYDRYRALTPPMIRRMNDFVLERQDEYFVFEKCTECV